MKITKILIIGFCSFFISFNAYNQINWSLQNPYPQNNDIYSVKFLNSNTGWAVGKFGTVLKTTNQGLNWNLFDIGTRKFLRSIFFTSQNSGYIAGDSGSLFKSTNGGENWFSQNVQNSISINDIYFINQDIGWMVGNSQNSKIYKTTNGGINWNSDNDLPYYSIYYSTFFKDEMLGWVCGSNGVIYKTTNGGTNWVLKCSFGTYHYLYDIFFNDQTTGWSVGSQGKILKTTNSGENWFQAFPIQTSKSFRCLDFYNQYGCIAGDSGKVYYTTNFGDNWSFHDSYKYFYYRNIGDDISIFSSHVYSENKIICAGKFGTIVQTLNGGINWSQLPEVINQFSSIQFINSSTGWFCGDIGPILKTTNGGENWIYQNTGLNIPFYSVYFLNNNLGFICGNSLRILKTTNSGNNWLTVNSGLTYNLYCVWFTDSLNGIAVGGGPSFIGGYEQDKILKTTNSGLSWNTTTLEGTKGPLRSIFFINQQTGWIGGDKKRIYKTSDMGNSWALQTSMNESGTFSSIKFKDLNTGWALLSSLPSYLMKTTNGGIEWVSIYSFSDYCSDLFLINDSNIWISTYNTKVLRSTNGGVSFMQNTFFTDYEFQRVYFTSIDTGWIAGNIGTIYKTINGSVSKVNQPVIILPEKYSLFQNYPNPFNPKTYIKFSIPKRNSVKIVIYNILGMMVETLIDKRYDEGDHEVYWNAEKYPSGVYFYKIITADFSETKRMVFVK